MIIDIKGHSGCNIDIIEDNGNLYVKKSTNDLKYLDRLNLQTVDIPTDITNLYLNIKNSSDVDINKYRSNNNKITIEGIYDFSNFEEFIYSLFAIIELS